MFKYLFVTTHHAKSDGDAVFDSNLPGLNLIAHKPHRVGIGTDEDDVVGLTGLSQLGALREKAIARMDGVGTSIQSRVNDLSYIEVSVFQRAVTERIGLVGHATVKSVGVIVGEDSHRVDVELLQGLDDAHRYLASVGDKDFIDSFAVHVTLMIPQKYKKKDNLCRLSFFLIDLPYGNSNYISTPGTSQRRCWHPG